MVFIQGSPPLLPWLLPSRSSCPGIEYGKKILGRQYASMKDRHIDRE